MKKEKIVKLLALTLSLSLLTVTFTGCGKKNDKQPATDNKVQTENGGVVVG